MSKYKEIKGFKVQTLASDTAASIADTGTWASGGSMNTARFSADSGTGTQTAAMIGGGYVPGTYKTANSEQYNGSSWTEVANLNTARAYSGGAGTTTAMVTFGGSSSPKAYTELWNGSSWTESGDLNTGRQSMGACGATSTAALAIAGAEPSLTADVEQWNGSSWTEIANVSTARYYTTGSGITTDALLIAGSTPPPSTAAVEKWNGSSWTEVGDLNTSRFALASASNPSGSDSSLAFGGYIVTPDGASAKNEAWDGTSWTEVNDLSSVRSYHAGAGASSASALAFGNQPTSGITEEFTTATSLTKINLGQVYYNSGSNAFKVTEQPVPGGTWSAGGNLNTGRNYLPEFAFATQTAGFAVGGNISPKQQTEQYNGSTWTEVADLNSALYGRSGFGTNASAVVAGGNGPPTSTNSETWDNSSWTEGNNLNTARRDAAGAGITTAGLVIGAPAVVESYNGTSYTEVADLNTGRSELGGGGTSTSALVFGGYTGSTTAATESWDGTSWTEVSDLNSAKSDNGTACISNQGALYFGNANEYWNGSSWTEVNDLSTSRVGLGGNGTTTSALAFGGYPITASTEEFTVPETNSTITVS